MQASEVASGSPLGRRERKKARTRAAIRHHAMRLFREQGFQATTVEQIAEAADVSQSTFFRYFPTKEAVVLEDDLDAPMIRAFRLLPPELGPVPALRIAFKQVVAQMTAEELEEERERNRLILEIPELHATMLDEWSRGIRMIAELVAGRSGRDPDDPQVRLFAGALIGVGLSALMTWAEDPSTDFYTVMDNALSYLEAGLPL
ncbi:MAG TPA: TetR family transcriptional regulator [Actinomycetota bacterium]|jgi:AcrR family transcriptional regulator